MSRVYISAKLEDEIDIISIRDHLFSKSDIRSYYKRVSPHITVVPPFGVKNGHEEDVEELVDSIDLRGRDVYMKDVDVWKSEEDPDVIMLDVDIDLEDVRNKLLNNLQGNGVDKITEPVDPHITLFKKEGEWIEVPEDTKEIIRKEVLSEDIEFKTEISSVGLEVSS